MLKHQNPKRSQFDPTELNERLERMEQDVWNLETRIVLLENALQELNPCK